MSGQPRHISVDEAVSWFPEILALPNKDNKDSSNSNSASNQQNGDNTNSNGENTEQKDTTKSNNAGDATTNSGDANEQQKLDEQQQQGEGGNNSNNINFQLTIIRPVGSGVSGTAFLVERAADRQKFIAKITDLRNMNDRKKGYARMEIQCLAQCFHFAIIQHVLHTVSADQSKILIIMEYADAGDLSRQVKHRARDNSFFREHEVAFLFLQLVLAIHYIHEKQMLHRDIKSANVFLMTCGVTKVGDFGFSQLYEGTVSNDVAGTFCGTPYYLAPELWRRQRYSAKADIWALGVVLYEMLALKRPFTAGSMLGLMDKVMAGEYEPIPTNYSDGMNDLVRRMLCFDPNGRPSTRELLAHPYMVTTMDQFDGTVRRLMPPDVVARILADLNQGRRASMMTPAPREWMGGEGLQQVKYRGCLQRFGSTGWRQRFLVLGGAELTISLVEQSVGDTKTVPVKYIQHVLPVQAQEADGRHFCFVIGLTNGQQHLFQAASEAEMTGWMGALQAATLEIPVN